MSSGTTGPALARELRDYRARVGMTLKQVTAVSGIPEQTLSGVGSVLWPLASTIRRIRDFIAEYPDGVPVADIEKAAMRRAAMIAAKDEALPPRVWRDPCPRCQVRADIGCAHSGPLPWDVARARAA